MKPSLLKATMINVLIGVCLALMLTGCQSDPSQKSKVFCPPSVPATLGSDHPIRHTDQVFRNEF